MTKEVRDALEAERRFRILNYVLSSRKIAAELRDFAIPKSTFYRWKAAYEKEGKAGLFRKKPVAKSYPGQIPKEHVEKILELRSQYHLGPQRILIQPASRDLPVSEVIDLHYCIAHLLSLFF